MTALPWLLGLSLLAPVTGDHGSHEHGVSRLDIVIDAGQMLVVLDGAGYNFVGFEREPRSDEENAAIVQALAEFMRPHALLGVPDAAQCRSGESHHEGLPSADWSAEDADALDHRTAPHAHHDDRAAGDLDRTLGNWRISFRFDCAQPNALHRLEPRLFEAFPNTRELHWQLLRASHQDGGRLSAPGGRIALQPVR